MPKREYDQGLDQKHFPWLLKLLALVYVQDLECYYYLLASNKVLFFVLHEKGYVINRVDQSDPKNLLGEEM
jgi:hypothetical protein